MPFKLPKDLSTTLNVSLKTVYNYINKYPDQIRTKREHWKTFIHSEDFANLLQKVQSPFKMNPKFSEEKQAKQEDWKENVSDSDLQSQVQSLSQTNHQLSTRSDNLERQVTKYALLLSEEKEEKKVRIEKYDQLNTRLSDKADEFADYKTEQLKKYFTLLAITIMLLLILGIFAARTNL